MAAVERTVVGTASRSDAAVVALAVVSLVWLGALLGVSFLATPVKFLAPTLTMPVALDVGRQTFHWFNRIEIVLAVAALVVAVAYDRPRLLDRAAARPYATVLAVVLAVGVGLQALWLLPLLDARVETIIQGGTPPPSSLHDVYVVIEAVKLGALVGAAWLAVAAMRPGSPHLDG